MKNSLQVGSPLDLPKGLIFNIQTKGNFHWVLQSLTIRIQNLTHFLFQVLHAFAFWLKGKQQKFIWLSAFTILIFRSELCILCGIMLLISLFKRQIHLINLIVNGALASILFIGISVLIDSYFWGYWLWPEGQVFWFNTILNKSSQWGTEPFLWYFYSALPRALLSTSLLVPFAFSSNFKSTFTFIFLPVIGFVFIYSILPHKELRFIMYVFPMFNVLGAKSIEDL